MIWDMRENQEVTDVESLLPSELVAKSPDENLTIFAITDSDGIHNYEIVEVYWPEREIGGFKNLYNYDSPNPDIKALTANWINSLPKRDFIPTFTIIPEVRGLILAAKSSYQPPSNASSPTVNSRVLVWDFIDDREASDVESFLPSELLANSLNGNITLFAIVKQTEQTVSHYSNGGPAIQKYWDILVLQWPENKVVNRHTVTGYEPPFIISVHPGDTSGASGDIMEPTAKWILSLPR